MIIGVIRSLIISMWLLALLVLIEQPHVLDVPSQTGDIAWLVLLVLFSASSFFFADFWGRGG
jgi:hypothetical protein